MTPREGRAEPSPGRAARRGGAARAELRGSEPSSVGLKRSGLPSKRPMPAKTSSETPKNVGGVRRRRRAERGGLWRAARGSPCLLYRTGAEPERVQALLREPRLPFSPICSRDLLTWLRGASTLPVASGHSPQRPQRSKWRQGKRGRRAPSAWSAVRQRRRRLGRSLFPPPPRRPISLLPLSCLPRR